MTQGKGTFDLTSYAFEISISKAEGGSKSNFSPGQTNQISGVANPDASLNTSTVKIDAISREYSTFARMVEVYWGLNSNPLVRVMFGPPQNRFIDFADFPGFLKNNAIGVRYSKPKISQFSPWIYGVIQYAVPRFNGKDRSVLVDGHGLLYEAGRRTTSRSFKNTTAKTIMANIVTKYGLTLQVKGVLSDIIIDESDQNVDDFAYLDQMALFLDALWYIEDDVVVLQSRQSMYTQTPKITLTLNASPPADYQSLFPIIDFVPEVSDDAFKTGGDKITARGIDLDSKKVVEKVFTPRVARMGVMSLNAPNFQSDTGIAVNAKIFKPAPVFQPFESGVFVPYRTRSDDEFRYQGMLEQRDVEVRATVRVPGAPIITPGIMVSVQGVGQIFGGNYIVESVYHRLNMNEGFTTDLLLARNAVGQFQRTDSGFQSNTKDTPEKAVVGTVKQAVPVDER